MADKSVILVIDDNMLVCTIVKDILKTKYEHIITMQDAEQGIAMAKKVLPDLTGSVQELSKITKDMKKK